jgi:hypothetical protein
MCALRIGCDLDGVLADMESELVRQAAGLFGGEAVQEPEASVKLESPPSPHALPPASTTADSATSDDTAPSVPLRLTDRQQRQLWRHVETIDSFWETLTEIEPGTIARLASLVAERRWEVIFLTRRPETAGSNSQVQTQRWLRAQGFDLPSVFVMSGSRGLVAAALALDFVIDDRPENCLDVVLDSTARAVLVWRYEAQRLPAAAQRPGVQVVTSMTDCLDLLIESDRPRRQRSSFVGWLKRQIRPST